jgi:hypothetical protein
MVGDAKVSEVLFGGFSEDVLGFHDRLHVQLGRDLHHEDTLTVRVIIGSSASSVNCSVSCIQIMELQSFILRHFYQLFDDIDCEVSLILLATSFARSSDDNAESFSHFTKVTSFPLHGFHVAPDFSDFTSLGLQLVLYLVYSLRD